MILRFNTCWKNNPMSTKSYINITTISSKTNSMNSNKKHINSKRPSSKMITSITSKINSKYPDNKPAPIKIYTKKPNSKMIPSSSHLTFVKETLPCFKSTLNYTSSKLKISKSHLTIQISTKNHNLSWTTPHTIFIKNTKLMMNSLKTIINPRSNNTKFITQAKGQIPLRFKSL